MKKLTLLAVLLAVATVLTGCNDDCRKVVCFNQGICVDGTCHCARGFEGSDCLKETREKFLGHFSMGVYLTCPISSLPQPVHLVKIKKHPDDIERIEVNVGGLTITAKAVGNTFVIDELIENLFRYTGNGHIASDSLFIQINEEYTASNELCIYSLRGPL